MRKILIICGTLIALTGSVDASTRLTYSVNGKPTPLYWAEGSFPLHYSIDARIAAMSGGQGEIERSFDAWVSDDTQVRFQFDGIKSSAAKEDKANIVSIADDLFKDSGFIAYTTTWFDDSGAIREADIQVDTKARVDGYSLLSLVEHEVGHFLGLDHSAIISSIMYPYVAAQGATALDSDDRIAMATLYPRASTAPRATIRGEIDDSNGPIFGAQVVAINDKGIATASALTDHSGRYSLKGLPAGKYRIYTEPLDGPVEMRNLSGVFQAGRNSSFRTQFLPDNVLVDVAPGGVRDVNTIRIDGPPATLNPRWVGVFAAGTPDVKLGTTAVRLSPGGTMNIAVGGDGFVSGMTTFETSNPGIVRVSDFQYGSNYIYATFKVAVDATPGSAVVFVKSGNEISTLSGALDLIAPARRRAAR
ncbi:MAG TPA: matrixin family metalloprotease [Thermoanaerobaculia bacterium]|nr:matrixin family metalloprotease [Thermoanaerobaculia bacterium]